MSDETKAVQLVREEHPETMLLSPRAIQVYWRGEYRAALAKVSLEGGA